MNVYKIEIDGCVTYHFAAPDMGAAFAAAWEGFADYDDTAALEDAELTIEQLPREKWPATYYDDGVGDGMSFQDLVARTTKAEVLICSEWP